MWKDDLLGYFGLAILARPPGPMGELTAVGDVDSFADLHEAGYADGWRLGFMDTPQYLDPGELAAQLVDETGAPAIVMYINDSDYADAACASPQGNTCRFYLDEQAFLAYCADFDQDDLAGVHLHRNDAAVDVLIRWAAEAGLTAQRQQLIAALAVRPGPACDGVHEFIRVLGAEQ